MAKTVTTNCNRGKSATLDLSTGVSVKDAIMSAAQDIEKQASAILKIAADSDCYKTPRIVDANSGKIVRFEPQQVPGKGWTVVKVTGSRRTGRAVEVADGFESTDGYTMHQAQIAAENLTHDTFRALAACQ